MVKPINITGKRATNKLLFKLGSFDLSIFFVAINSLSGLAFTFGRKRVKNGPEINIEGIAKTTP